MTKTAAIRNAIAALQSMQNSDPETIETLTAMVEKLETASKNRKPTKAELARKAENADLSARLYSAMWAGKPMDIDQLHTIFPECSPAKITALMRLMAADGRVTVDRSGKRNAYTKA